MSDNIRDPKKAVNLPKRIQKDHQSSVVWGKYESNNVRQSNFVSTTINGTQPKKIKSLLHNIQRLLKLHQSHEKKT